MPDERQQYGGQAVVEGVMMRSPRFFAVACRRLSNNEIVVKQEPVENTLRKVMWLNKPFLRGTLALIDAMAMGMKALTYAANVQMEDERGGRAGSPRGGRGGHGDGRRRMAPSRPNPGEPGATQSINGITIGLTSVLALLIGFGLFWTLPAFLTDRFSRATGGSPRTWSKAASGWLIFFAYIGLISRMGHVQRVFQYHGAEHKAINTWKPACQ